METPAEKIKRTRDRLYREVFVKKEIPAPADCDASSIDNVDEYIFRDSQFSIDIHSDFAVIARCRQSSPYLLELPEGVPYEGRWLPITKIGKNAFRHDSDLRGLRIPKNITHIESGAFEDCRNLSDIYFSFGLKHIGVAAFESTNLRSVIIPESVERIEDYAFYRSNINSAYIPDGITLGTSVFAENPLHTLTVPHNTSLDSLINPQTTVEYLMLPYGYAVTSLEAYGNVHTFRFY